MTVTPELLEPFAEDMEALVALIKPWAEVSGNLPLLNTAMQEALDSVFFSGPEVIAYVDPADVDGEEADGTEPITWVCPHGLCDGYTFYEVDRSWRWNGLEPDTDSNGNPFFAVNEQDNENHTVGFRCQHCDRGVSIPEWAETVWG